MIAALVLSTALLAPVASEDLARYDLLVGNVGAEYDTSRGGFVFRDGRPSEASVELAFLIGRERDESEWTARALRTVDWTISLFDTVGGGFLERSRDADPKQASFEKYTRSNAERMMNLLEAVRASDDPKYRKFAARVVDYADRVLLDGRGGFVHGQVGDRQLIPESNGAILRAWLAYAALDGNVRMRNFAWKSLDRLWTECWMVGPGMVRRTVFGEIESEPRLADQYEIGRAYVWSAHMTGRASDLDRARTIGDGMLATYEQDNSGFRAIALPNKKGVIKNGARNGVENARAARFLAELAAVTGEAKYREAARRAMTSFEKSFKDQGLQGAEWALALRALNVPDLPARPVWKDTPKSVADAEAPPPQKRSKRY